MRPITRRVSTVRLPKPCGYCMGDVYIGVEGYDGAVCIDCKKQPAKPYGPQPTPDDPRIWKGTVEEFFEDAANRIEKAQ